MNQLTLVKTVTSRHRRLKIRRLRYTCQARTTAEATKTRITGKVHPEAPPATDPLSYGVESVIGGRKEMEDAARAELGFFSGGGKTYDFFGVYDGHGGARVAEVCGERMHRLVAKEMAEAPPVPEPWERVMERAFERMDEEVAAERIMGSTAVVAVVGPDEIVVANCGDSRAVISRAGVAVPLSVDHKPDRADEYERIEAAGGKVINWNGQRILGVLATSRSIGDDYLKPFVISKPDTTVIKRSKTDEFLILASDGLWDVMSNEVACKIGRRCLSGSLRRKKSQHLVIENRAAKLAAILTELAVARGSRDNISVIVVDLQCRQNFS